MSNHNNLENQILNANPDEADALPNNSQMNQPDAQPLAVNHENENENESDDEEMEEDVFVDALEEPQDSQLDDDGSSRSIITDEYDGPLPNSRDYGCVHYSRRCELYASCCDKYYTCRHCHNEDNNHELDRHKVDRVRCMECQHVQSPPSNTCDKCNTVFGQYACLICNFFEDDVSKEQYHCVKCGICRLGGQRNFFHCDTCASCVNIALKNNHKCVERAMHQNCPICLEYLFTSQRPVSVLRCGHTLHRQCLKLHCSQKYTCPLCNKCIVDMTTFWAQMTSEIERTPMPEEYASMKCLIHCNDCNIASETSFHFYGHQCNTCHGYNTRVDKRFTPIPLSPAQIPPGPGEVRP